MLISEPLKKIFESGKSFAFYFRPAHAQIELVVGDAELTNDISACTGFVFAPYIATEHTPTLLISPEVYVKGDDAVAQAIDELSGDGLCKIDDDQMNSKTQVEFESIVQHAIDRVNDSSVLEKVVLSRPMSQSLPELFDPIDFLHKMHGQMPNAFCYLTYTPQSGMWMGATPERLFEYDGLVGKTNSIAGTMPAQSSRDWTLKEKNEQQIVSTYIHEELKLNGISDITINGPITVKSGSVQHLKTEFSFPITERAVIGQLIKALHPTPAICGMPKSEAQTFIAEHEGYDREYYSGYLGPLGLDNSHSIFVNLRCMKVMSDVATLYVGAGISDGSVAEAEWEETQTKALTLLNLLQSN